MCFVSEWGEVGCVQVADGGGTGVLGLWPPSSLALLPADPLTRWQLCTALCAITASLKMISVFSGDYYKNSDLL